MKFWVDGKPCDTATMVDAEKVKLLESIEAEWQALLAKCQSFGRATDQNAWAVEHYGRDGQWKLYNDRSYVETMLAGEVIDLFGCDRVIALCQMGKAPSFKKTAEAAQQARLALKA